MVEWEAPAKVNVDLRVGSLDSQGMHPLRSVVQTIGWCDTLVIEAGDDDRLAIIDEVDSDLPEGGSNLVWRAIELLAGRTDRPGLDVTLTKRVAVAAGLGGGSSDAAAALRAVATLLGVSDDRVRAVAPDVGADVALFLDGGTQLMEGHGESLTTIQAMEKVAVAVVVPRIELSTPEVYRRWDDLNGPVGASRTGSELPPPIRRFEEIRNDLLPAAISLRPELADWMADLETAWSTPVFMSGSGPAIFGWFGDPQEALEALAVAPDRRAGAGVEVRTFGVAPQPR